MASTKRRVLTPILLTLAVGGSFSRPDPAQANGFVDDAEVELNIRNYYHYRNFLDPIYPQAKAEEWVQAFILNANSGFTPGPVGFAVDVIGQFGIKLDGGRGTSGTQLLPPGSPDDVSRLGGALKAQYSETLLTVGETGLNLPVLRADLGRIMPQTYEGAMLKVQEIENLTFHVGQIWATSLRNSIDMDEDLSFGGATSDRFRYVGAEYRFNDERTLVGLWGAELKDIYRQQLLGLEHEQPAGDWVFETRLGVFLGNEDGRARAGSRDNKTYSGLFAAGYGSHKFTLGLQKVTGNSPWMRVGATDGTSSGGSLANDSLNASFDNEDERSWGVRYDYNFAGLNLPGLLLTLRYIQGDNITIRSAGVEDGSEWARELHLTYILQAGPLEGLSLSWRNSSLRRSWSNSTTSDFNENRVYLSYPLSLR